MKTRAFNRRHPSVTLPLLLSFNELAWIGFAAIAILLALELKKSRQLKIQVDEARVSSEVATNALTRALEKAHVERSQFTTSLAAVTNVHRLNARVAELEKQVSTSTSIVISQALVISDLNRERRALDQQLQRAIRAHNPAEVLPLQTFSKAVPTELDPEAFQRKELLGLRGTFSNVVLAVDCSASMKESGRWTSAQTLIATWVKHLPMHRCAVVLFNDRVEHFPETNVVWLSLQGDDRTISRQRLTERLASIDPVGYTDTATALKEVFKCYVDADTVILFTDGRPELPPQRGIKPARLTAEVIRLLESRKLAGSNIPVNTVGLGDYFEGDLGKFLLKVAEVTGGVFIGR